MFPADLSPGVRIIRSHTGLRGIAAFSVVLIHLRMMFGERWGLSVEPLSAWNWGWPAVDLFFILSGYILHHVYLRADSPVDWHKYLVARVARITPLYYLTLFVAPVAGIPYLLQLMQLPRDVSFYGYQHGAIMIANLLMVAGLIDGGQYPANGPSWSISVEMLLYVTMFPLLVLSVPKMPRALVWACTMLSTLLLFVTYTDLLPHRIWGWSWVYVGRGVGGFATGFLLCHMARANLVPAFLRSDAARRVCLYAIVPACCLLAFGGVIAKGALNLVFPMLVLYTASDRGLLAQALGGGLFQWLGDRSYSIYLWHYPIFYYMERHLPQWLMGADFAALPALRSLCLIAVVLVISSLSFRFFEIPAQRLIRRLGTPRRAVEVGA
jgi:peptidoglycan/LPS O-acetylase OafA/YrhL